MNDTSAAKKIDLRKTYKALYGAKSEPSFVEVPGLSCFTIEGSGDPNGSPRFQECLKALYAASFTLKFALKNERGVDWTVLGLEGDWYCDNMADFSMEHKETWKWKLLIVQPDFITDAEAQAAVKAARAKKDASPALADLRFERRQAERSAHILHIGSYDDEPPTIGRLHAFIAEKGFHLTGLHREIYLSDARRVAPERLKTIIRQPFI